tara:strand:+ start:93 stop:272 length:180 start_codon:yes stop_codon:yes gene_type:complete
MNTAIFIVGFVIFVTYMFFLVRMINIAHKQQEKEQGKFNYKSQNMETMKKIVKELEEEK